MKLKTNIVLQVIYQVIILIVPLILSKYITNVINKDVLGVYTYSYSIANYFVILSMLGIQKYGTRLISQAKASGDEIFLRKSFRSLFYLHVFISLISLVSYFLIFSISQTEDRMIFIIQGIYVASALFDVTWLFYGLENFKSVIFKNIFIKICEVICIFLFVKNNGDLWIYTVIMALSIFAGQFVLIPQAIKLIKPVKVSVSDMKPHIKPMLILSVSVVASSIYSFLDKTLLGMLSASGKGDVALYEYSDKIIRIPISVLTAVETVMLPRMSYLSGLNDSTKIKKMIYNSIIIFALFSVGAMFGVISIANCFVRLWYGSDYVDCGKIIVLLSPIIFFISFGDVIRSQFLIPNKKDALFTFTVILGAVINLAINLIAIPFIGIYGAIISTLIAEGIICFSQFFIARKDLPIFKYFCESIPFFAIGFIMLSLNYLIEMHLGVTYYTLAIQIILGLLVYCLLSFAYLYIFRKKFLVEVLPRFFRRE